MKTQFDNRTAESEGWFLSKDGETKRLDDGPVINECGDQSGEPVFESDMGAILHVWLMAEAGSKYHKKALKLANNVLGVKLPQ